MNKEDFGDNFTWGVSSAAFQIEGSHDVDGKGLSIWDVFAANRRNIKGGHHARVACDFYKNYNVDIDLIEKLSIPNFRFSISCPRVMPEGIGAVNLKGLTQEIVDRVVAVHAPEGAPILPLPAQKLLYCRAIH